MGWWGRGGVHRWMCSSSWRRAQKEVQKWGGCKTLWFRRWVESRVSANRPMSLGPIIAVACYCCFQSIRCALQPFPLHPELWLLWLLWLLSVGVEGCCVLWLTLIWTLVGQYNTPEAGLPSCGSQEWRCWGSPAASDISHKETVPASSASASCLPSGENARSFNYRLKNKTNVNRKYKYKDNKNK